MYRLTLFILLSVVGFLFAEDAILFDFSSLRKQGMGGVFVATALNNTALVENPAGLYYAESLYLPRLSLQYSQDFSDKYGAFSDLYDIYDQNQTNAAQFGTGQIIDGINAYNNLIPFEGAVKGNTNLFSISNNGLGVGVYGSGFMELNLPGGVNTISGRADVAPSLGLARKYNLWGPTIVGASVKLLNRSIVYDKNTGEESIQLTDAQMIQIVNGRENVVDFSYYNLMGLGFDLGFLRPMKIKSKDVLVGVNFKNIGTTLSGTKSLNGSNDTTYDEDVKKTVPTLGTVGISMTEQLFRWVPFVGRFTRNTQVALDYNFVSPYDQFAMNLHAGIEQELFGSFLKLRGGLNQGFVVGGVGMDIKVAKIPLLQFDYAYYTEEFGAKLGYDYYSFQAFKLGILF